MTDKALGHNATLTRPKWQLPDAAGTAVRITNAGQGVMKRQSAADPCYARCGDTTTRGSATDAWT